MNENLNESVKEELDSDGRASGVEREQDESDSGTEIVTPFDPAKIDIRTRSPSVDNLLKRLDHDEVDLNQGFNANGVSGRNRIRAA